MKWFRAILDTSRNSIGRVSRRGSEREWVLSADASSEFGWGARNTVTDLGTRAPNMRLLGGSVQKVCQSCALGSILRVLRCPYHCKSCSGGRDRGGLGSAFTSKGGPFGALRRFRSVPDTSRNSIGRVSRPRFRAGLVLVVVRSDGVLEILSQILVPECPTCGFWAGALKKCARAVLWGSF